MSANTSFSMQRRRKQVPTGGAPLVSLACMRRDGAGDRPNTFVDPNDLVAKSFVHCKGCVYVDILISDTRRDEKGGG